MEICEFYFDYYQITSQRILEITLIDRTPFHSLKTEFYALAAGTSTDKEVRVDFPEHLRLKRVYGEITKIDTKRKLFI